MGLRITSMLTLEYAKKNYDISFGKTLTLGRQFKAFSAAEAGKYMAGRSLSADALNDPYVEKAFKEMYGSELLSLDGFDHEGAQIIHDLNVPVGDGLKGQFSCIIDGGTMEHVFNVPMVVKNCLDMLKVGGYYIAMVPTNNFNGHGLYQFSPDFFYSVFSEVNGVEIKDVFIVKFSAKNKVWKITSSPKNAGGRVQFDVNTQTEIYVIAKKIAETPAQITAQQTDYEEGWYEEGRSISNTASRDSLIEKAPRKLVYTFRQFIYEPWVRRRHRKVIKL